LRKNYNGFIFTFLASFYVSIWYWSIDFGGGLFAVFKAYGGKEFWNQYKIWIQILIWGFIYVSSIHLLMTVSALNDYPQLYLVILSFYIFNVFLLTRKIT